MNDPATVHRQLKIKCGATKRLLKEHSLYRKEAEEQKRKHDKMVADGADEWDVRSAAKILDEAKRMIVDADTRLGNVVQELRSLIILVKQQPSFAEDEELIKAEEVLEEASV
ncbi:hypothetical protein SERLA73DRAFT_190110 [Serpula lacrymans var. lacrymans S7.3]|uniref:Tubulin-specific chaperone A n=2 Tax=Serpula lacrymans var. lacrymans TaxID=341189 RepID=F8QF31_SERL3|nr:uncharacterized protein SERLADRAFT_455743 [Serpula lacrymans var. lacrymans S7.9]EGN93194.1 hypothetical protein SERLA73DRAFT_190110 [Serpula lacrymans var. lacrymans S7.3]EGO31094.1 hypothetical protein SERLADRAFT_455743 [Serpula lacrymans var. lacrymans S7.9]